MTCMIFLSPRYSEPHHMPRKLWSRTPPVEPDHRVPRAIDAVMQQFMFYRLRKPWKDYHYRRKVYKMRDWSDEEVAA